MHNFCSTTRFYKNISLVFTELFFEPIQNAHYKESYWQCEPLFYYCFGTPSLIIPATYSVAGTIKGFHFCITGQTGFKKHTITLVCLYFKSLSEACFSLMNIKLKYIQARYGWWRNKSWALRITASIWLIQVCEWTCCSSPGMKWRGASPVTQTAYLTVIEDRRQRTKATKNRLQGQADEIWFFYWMIQLLLRKNVRGAHSVYCQHLY